MKISILLFIVLYCNLLFSQNTRPVIIERDSLDIQTISIDFANIEDFYNRINDGTATPQDIEDLNILKSYSSNTLSIIKTHPDNIDRVLLTIEVSSPCNNDFESEDFKVDGIVNSISATMHYKGKTDNILYYNPNVLMSLINLKEQNIIIKYIDYKYAVIFPFSYCSNADKDITISYIIFYNHKKYLFHINLTAINDFDKYQLNDDLHTKLKSLPKKIRKEFVTLLNNTNFDHLLE